MLALAPRRLQPDLHATCCPSRSSESVSLRRSLPTTAGLLAVTAYVVLGSAVLLRDAGRLNLLALGDEPIFR